jgi:glutathione synthase/RimK-type ligase-like ATP-grasp enzyme
MRDILNNKVTHFLMQPAMQDPSTLLFMKNLIFTLENIGIICFPSFKDYYTFDDKVSQKYVFESLGIPSPDTFVFYRKIDAVDFIKTSEFPIVAKLNKGAGAINVRLLRNKEQANRYINTAFSIGFDATSAVFKDVTTKFKNHNKKKDWLGVLKRAPQTILGMISHKFSIQRERGFVLFQEFVPGNNCDIRVTVIGKKAFIFKRLVRENDFRASGSGSIVYDVDESELTCIRKAFDVAERLGSHCIALDFVRSAGLDQFVVIEYSYAFKAEAVYECPGFWDEHLNFHQGSYRPELAMLESMNIL